MRNVLRQSVLRAQARVCAWLHFIIPHTDIILSLVLPPARSQQSDESDVEASRACGRDKEGERVVVEVLRVGDGVDVVGVGLAVDVEMEFVNVVVVGERAVRDVESVGFVVVVVDEVSSEVELVEVVDGVGVDEFDICECQCHVIIILSLVLPPARSRQSDESVGVFVVVEASVGGDEVGEDVGVEKLDDVRFVEERLVVDDGFVVDEVDRERRRDFEFVEVDGGVGAGGAEVVGVEVDADGVCGGHDSVGHVGHYTNFGFTTKLRRPARVQALRISAQRTRALYLRSRLELRCLRRQQTICHRALFQ